MKINNITLNNFKSNYLIKNQKNEKGEKSKEVSYNTLPSFHINSSQINFCSLKKSNFSGVDLLVINMFKAPIEKFKTSDDFKNWCKEKTKDITNKQYKGGKSDAAIQTRETLHDWFSYFKSEENPYSDSEKLLILSGIVQEIKENDNRLPLKLNKDILEKTVEIARKKANSNPKSSVNFASLYESELKSKYLEDCDLDENLTGWLDIPSFSHDGKNFDDNVNKLNIFSHHNWCTKSTDAKPYLRNGDICIYLEKGAPKLCVRYTDDLIQEIQGEKNNTKIPFLYYDVLISKIGDDKYINSLQRQFDYSNLIKNKVDSIKQKIAPRDFKELTPKEIFEFFNIKVKEDEDKKLILSEYHQPDNDFTYADLGINEDELLKNVKRIEGDAHFEYSTAKTLGGVESIGKSAFFKYSDIKSLSKLKSIGEYVDFHYSDVQDLGELRYVGGSINFNHSKIKSLNKLEKIEQMADFRYSDICNLGNLEYIGACALLNDIITPEMLNGILKGEILTFI